MPLSRRTLLLSSAATALLSFVAMPFARAKAAKLDAMFTAFVDELLDRSPETATGLGLDTGKRAYEKARLNDRSLASIAQDKARTADQLRRLKTIGRKALSATDGLNYDVVLYTLQTQDAANRTFDYGPRGAGAPYIVSQLGGAYQSIPDFLDSQHSIETKTDADDYLARLEAFAAAMDQECEVVRHDAGASARRHAAFASGDRHRALYRRGQGLTGGDQHHARDDENGGNAFLKQAACRQVLAPEATIAAMAAAPILGVCGSKAKARHIHYI